MATRRERPYGQFNFQVEITDVNDATAASGGSLEVSGLGIEVTVAECRNGNDRFNFASRILGLTYSGLIRHSENGPDPARPPLINTDDAVAVIMSHPGSRFLAFGLRDRRCMLRTVASDRATCRSATPLSPADERDYRLGSELRYPLDFAGYPARATFAAGVGEQVQVRPTRCRPARPAVPAGRTEKS